MLLTTIVVEVNTICCVVMYLLYKTFKMVILKPHPELAESELADSELTESELTEIRTGRIRAGRIRTHRNQNSPKLELAESGLAEISQK